MILSTYNYAKPDVHRTGLCQNKQTKNQSDISDTAMTLKLGQGQPNCHILLNLKVGYHTQHKKFEWISR